jgi:hypothetical protein
MNTPTNPTDNDLTTRLAHEADAFFSRGGTALEIGQVLDRAGEVRRGRRMRATLLMAACVLAIAVPTTLVALNRDPNGPSRTPTPAAKMDTSPLTLDGLDQGDAPRTGYIQDGRLTVDGFTYASSGEKYVAFATYTGGVMVAVRHDGQLVAHSLDSSVESRPMEGGFAASADGSLVAFVQPDGTPVVVSSTATGDPRRSYALPRIPRGSGFDAVALNGQGCRSTVELPCSVWVTSHGSSPESWTSTAHDIARLAQNGLRTVTDVASSNSPVAGIIDVRPDLTTCSAVVPLPEKTPTWTTCDHRLLTFSPDDQRLLATGSVGDGLGDRQLAVLDAATGKVELDLRTVDQALITQMVWEDDSHVLANVHQDGQWAIVRIGLDGSREYAVPPVTATDDSPFVLPSS